MSREIIMVPENWEHPKNLDGRYKPLSPFSYYESVKEDFIRKFIESGLQEAIDYCGNAPDINDYMPDWTSEEKTHYMMYETTSEGTPISPAFKTPEEVAMWCFENKVSAFGSQTASYEAWLRVANGGFAVSAVAIPGRGLISGVEALTQTGE
jgi:hypothetical protein